MHTGEKPSRPITIYPLAFVALAGLVAQFLAARSAFDFITSNPIHSIAAALLIEAATVTEALVFVRSGNKWAAGGLALTMLVSGTYNYTQASRAGAGLGQWQLIAMSVGPLAALVSVGLALGDELRKYEGALGEWQAIQDEIAQEEAATFRRETIKAEREADEQKRWERQLEQQRLAAELELQAQAQAAQIKEQGLALRRAEKRALVKDEQAVSVRSVSGQVTTPEIRWPDKAAFVADTDRPDGLTTNQLAEMAEIAPRTARRWLAAVRSDNGKES